MSTQNPQSADGVVWNLADLYASVDDPRLKADLEAAHERARTFEAAYRGQIDTPTGPPAALLLKALTELEDLSEQMDRPVIYAHLLHPARTDDPRHGALLVKTDEKRTQINKHLIFFDLEWVKLDDAIATRLTADPALARYRHALYKKRMWKPHYLSEPEEK